MLPTAKTISDMLPIKYGTKKPQSYIESKISIRVSTQDKNKELSISKQT